jgi:hypothetical protein
LPTPQIQNGSKNERSVAFRIGCVVPRSSVEARATTRRIWRDQGDEREAKGDGMRQLECTAAVVVVALTMIVWTPAVGAAGQVPQEHLNG